jgi:general secretion pathway protein D
MKKLFIICMLIGLTVTFETQAQADLQQKLKGYVNPEELVTLSETIPFSQAIEIMSKVSEKLTGKKIVCTVSINTPIGVEIEKMSYKKALIIIAQYNNLIIEETENSTVVKRKDVDKTASAKEGTYANVDEREVKISAVIFEADVNTMHEKGINWQALFSQSGLSVAGNLITASSSDSSSSSSSSSSSTQASTPSFTTTVDSKFKIGKTDGTITAALNFFETENLGKIISRPTISVVNGQQGRTQVGSDIAIKERDFSGNLIDRFYSTGTIIEVTPYIYTEDGIDYVYLNTKVEKSSALTGSSSTVTEITKTAASTKLLMLDNEEVAIGGLFVNDETTIRRGVPFLKDLPWWVFGLKYIFGYDQLSISNKEIILLIKVNITPTLKERIEQKKQERLLNKEWQKQTDEMQQYKDDIDKARADKKAEREKKQEEESNKE